MNHFQVISLKAGRPKKKAFSEPQHHTLIQSIRLTSPSWREIAPTGQTYIELCGVTVDVSLLLHPYFTPLWGGCNILIGFMARLCGQQGVLYLPLILE